MAARYSTGQAALNSFSGNITKTGRTGILPVFELLDILQDVRQVPHVPAYLFVGNFGVPLRSLDVLVSYRPAGRFDGDAVGQADFRRVGVAAHVPGDMLGNARRLCGFLNAF